MALLTSAPRLSPGGTAVMFKLCQAGQVSVLHMPQESMPVIAHWENQAAVPMIGE